MVVLRSMVIDGTRDLVHGGCIYLLPLVFSVYHMDIMKRKIHPSCSVPWLALG